MKLRPYRHEDAQTVLSWIADEFAFRQWSADRYGRYPITPEDMNAAYDAMCAGGSFFPMTAYDDSGIIGHMILRFTDGEKTIMRFGFVIVDPMKRGHGLGKEMLRLALGEAFGRLGAKTVTLGVFENNLPAYRCYKSAGFRDVPAERPEYYHVLGENWKCLEMRFDAESAERVPDDAAGDIVISAERIPADEYIGFLKRTDLGSQYPKERFWERIARLVDSVPVSLSARNREGLLVGALFGLTDFSYWLFVTDLGVDRDYERRGIGRRLLKAAHETAGGEKDIAVYLVANEDAVPFYIKCGMEQADDVMQYNHIEWTPFSVEQENFEK